MRVFIIAPTPMSQAGLQTLLSSPSIHVTGNATNAASLPESASMADVLVLVDDIQIEEIIQVFPQATLVVVTNQPERLLPLLSNSELAAWGIVPLETTPTQLQSAVHAVAQGLVVLPISSARQISERQTRGEVVLLPGTEEALTSREREVLELVGQGLPNKLIARRLQISEHTVKFHLASVSTKLGAVSRTDAVRLGLRQGLITL
ncbi:response regulator transcription factor [Dictyobacter arantiisoli]|uniref:Helix-turn-helix transcriptional regulator n=1 Tax=Dictyobacter arantiisoli TaxID=2014874 RepID=A0A5A5TGV4_9CHLR|nr:response regulator transcription factor [Dictyobacter arantiisoli]GCF10465.1 helix-turn-helix transcriptional regulator [Dictyobacter arantiisoli]